MKSRFSAITDYTHGSEARIGVLLCNLGTPEAPEPGALRRYLKEFLSDPRVVEVPRLLWWMILNLVILNIRPKRSAAAYAKVWTDNGSPLMVHSLAQRDGVAAAVERTHTAPVAVELAMRYGQPSVANAMRKLRDAGITKLIVLPLYPQYSGSTTGSVFDAVADELKSWRVVPEMRFINEYYADDGYINALAASISRYREQHGAGDRLMFSFHGVPQRYFDSGDPYHCHCYATAARVAATLGLSQDQWILSFQSRFGREPWLKPYTDHTLKEMGDAGLGRIDVVCPGFASDCIETLEEIDMENREVFTEAGGKDFHYIPCLNEEAEHIDALANLIASRTADWDTQLMANTPADREAARDRAMAVGAQR